MENVKINSIKFFEAFKKELYENTDKTLNAYPSDKKWTAHLKDIIENVLHKLKYETNNEYFRIDKIGWSGDEKRFDKKLGINRHSWNLDVAVEYENKSADWTDEVIKLCHIRCSLKVVIGYSSYKDRDKGGKSDIDKLDEIAKDMKNLKYGYPNGCDCAKEEFMIILGNCRLKKKYENIEDDIDFRAYTYDRGNFSRLK